MRFLIYLSQGHGHLPRMDSRRWRPSVASLLYIMPVLPKSRKSHLCRLLATWLLIPLDLCVFLRIKICTCIKGIHRGALSASNINSHEKRFVGKHNIKFMIDNSLFLVAQVETLMIRSDLQGESIFALVWVESYSINFQFQNILKLLISLIRFCALLHCID